MPNNTTPEVIRINTEISGLPARILLDLKRRGIVSNNTDAVIQGLMLLHEKMLKLDLAEMRLQLQEGVTEE